MSNVCETCLVFEEHESGQGKNPDNCVKWLCNCNACPHDSEISGSSSSGGTVCMSLQVTDEDQGCTAHLCRF